jgi:hypothetical protein
MKEADIKYARLIPYDGITFLFKKQLKDRELERGKRGEVQKEASLLCDLKEGLP